MKPKWRLTLYLTDSRFIEFFFSKEPTIERTGNGNVIFFKTEDGHMIETNSTYLLMETSKE